MKILFVAHLIPIPSNAGNRARILAIIRELVRWGHEVHYACLNASGTPVAQFDELERFLGGGRAYEIKVRPPYRRETFLTRGRRRVLRLVKHEAGYRVPLDLPYDSRATEQLRAIHRAVGFDIVFVEYVFLSRAFEAFDRGVFRVLDTHDSFGNRHKEFLKAGEEPSWYSTTPREEETGFRRADVVIAIQSEEERRFRARLGKDGGRVRTVSHVVDLSRRAEPTGAPAASFVGSLNAVNTAALHFLIDEVLPKVLRQRPDFKLLVAGLISRRVGARPGVEACGLVENLAEFFARTSMSLNPIAVGTGINIKLLEAMACGMPSISTETGARGLESRFRGGVLIVPDRDPDAFATAVLDLLMDPERCRSMSARAFADAALWNSEQISALRDVIDLASGHTSRLKTG